LQPLANHKHALVQDAAYDSLLRARRQELHGKIGRVIESVCRTSRQPSPSCWRTTTPRRKLPDKTIPLWQKAGSFWDSLFPALRLANALRRDDALVPILWGLFIHSLCRGRIAE
jgi:hypothetical protein